MEFLRSNQWDGLKSGHFDVLIIGGGISGTCLFHNLSGAGCRTLLIDKGDFASAVNVRAVEEPFAQSPKPK